MTQYNILQFKPYTMDAVAYVQWTASKLHRKYRNAVLHVTAQTIRNLAITNRSHAASHNSHS